MSRIAALGELGRASDAAYVPQPQPANVASQDFSLTPAEGTRKYLDFTIINDYIEFDGVRISRGGMPFQIGHHPSTPDNAEWRYALIAPGTDPVRFVIDFVKPVREWAINGSSYVNGGVPAHPFAYTWYENPAYNGPVRDWPNGDVSNQAITAPSVHNKYKRSYDFGAPTGLIVRAELGVYLEWDGNYHGQPELNGFIGAFMQWAR